MKQRKAPGKRWIKNMSLRAKWLLFLVLGIIFFVLMLFAISESVVTKIQNPELYNKSNLLFLYATAMLIAAVIFLMQSFRFRAMMDARKILRKALQKERKFATNKKHKKISSSNFLSLEEDKM